MQIEDIKRMAYTVLEQNHIETDYIEYKKSVNFKSDIFGVA